MPRQSGRHELLARMPLTPLTCRGRATRFQQPCRSPLLTVSHRGKWLMFAAGRFNHATQFDHTAGDPELLLVCDLASDVFSRVLLTPKAMND